MRSSPKDWMCLDWKGRQQQQDTDHFYCSTCYLPPLFYLSILSKNKSKNSKVISIGKLWDMARTLFIRNVSPLTCAKREKVRRQRNPGSNSPNKYPTTSLHTHPPSGKHTGLFSLCSHVLLFSRLTSLLDPAHISVMVILLFSYLLQVLKLYISAKFLEHCNKSVAYNFST